MIKYLEGKTMRQVSISRFKANFHALLARVRSTGKPIRITRFGKPLAEIVPANVDEGRLAWIGSMKNSVKIKGDIISPANDEDEWEVLRD
jgi:prevent-host-death family protein